MTKPEAARWGVLLGEAGLLGVGLSALTANADWWFDAAVLTTTLSLVPSRSRWSLAASSVLTWCSFPPCVWPTYWVTLVPCIAAWRSDSEREASERGRQRRPVVDWLYFVFGAWVAGFVICWTTVAPLRHLPLPGSGVAVALCTILSGLYGLLMLPMAVAVRALQGWKRILPAALLGAGLITVARDMLANLLGVEWLAQAMVLPASNSPVAQWAQYLGQSGVAGVILLMNLLVAISWASRTARHRSGSWALQNWAIPLGAWALVSIGGTVIQMRTPGGHVPFRAVLIQPHVVATPENHDERTAVLRKLTRQALDEAGEVDLVVWPESSLDVRNAASDPEWLGKVFSTDDEPCPAFLVGVIRTRPVDHVIYGVPTIRMAQTNSAALLAVSGQVQYHDKQKLLPLVEYVPEWMRTETTSRWLHGTDLEPGVPTSPLRLTLRDHRPADISVSLCYEKLFGSLSQFQRDQAAVIHLTENSWSREQPLIAQVELWACQYRAIETRTWQLQAASWQGTAVVDPLGRLRQSLGSRAGWLIVPGAS